MHRTHHLFFVNVLLLLFVVDFFIERTSALTCYSCSSTFPNNQICLPSCSSSFQSVNTCVLTRNISLNSVGLSSLVAGPINNFPSLASITDQEFLFGEEAIYHNPSVEIGWETEYGPISYGCDTDNCNDPRYINRLPDALNVNIPNTTLSQLLEGDLVANCYVCNSCVDENNPTTAMDSCTIETCPSRTCWFLASQNSPRNLTICPNKWSFISGCRGAADPAQVDMTLKYNILTNSTYLYEMEAVCHNEKCNNFTIFKLLKDAIKVNPNLDCLSNIANATTSTSTFSSSSRTSTTTRSSSSTSSSSSSTSSSTSTSTTSRTSTRSTGGSSGPSGSTTGTKPSTTTTSSALGLMEQNTKLCLLFVFLSIIQRFF